MLKNLISVKSNELYNISPSYLFFYGFPKFIRSELFEDETEYPRLFSLDTNPEQLYEMEIKWSRGIDTITTKMNLAYINVTALSFERFVLNGCL